MTIGGIFYLIQELLVTKIDNKLKYYREIVEELERARNEHFRW